jgi:hypothetical protein
MVGGVRQVTRRAALLPGKLPFPPPPGDAIPPIAEGKEERCLQSFYLAKRKSLAE